MGLVEDIQQICEIPLRRAVNNLKARVEALESGGGKRILIARITLDEEENISLEPSAPGFSVTLIEEERIEVTYDEPFSVAVALVMKADVSGGTAEVRATSAEGCVLAIGKGETVQLLVVGE